MSYKFSEISEKRFQKLQTMFPDLGWDIEVLDGYKRFILIIDNFSVTMFMVSL
jgi:hypothetical protein